MFFMLRICCFYVIFSIIGFKSNRFIVYDFMHRFMVGSVVLLVLLFGFFEDRHSIY